MRSKLAFVAGAIIAGFAFSGEAIAQTAGGWAVVAQDGTLGHNLNVKSVDHKGTGIYLVKFNQDVTACSTTATIAGAGKRSIIPGYIVVSHPKGDAEIKVNTFLTATLLPADFRFNIQVMC
ncbi:MAG TPA: hypothetical protein VMF58_00850 [Rhizomicrobium sp.]|nr:hypothetical protein [Rhizomicrobium sp.]